MEKTNNKNLGSLKSESNKRFEALKEVAQKYIPAWQILSQYIDPTRGIFNNDRSKIGSMIDHKTLLDSHATHAKRVTASGMQMGMTNQSRPWFKLTMDNFLLDSVQGAREWLDEVTRILLEVLNKSNLYKVFYNCYDELVTFGTGCFIILEDFEDVVRGRSFTIGEYYLGTDSKGRVNAFAREFEMKVGQIVNEFGIENVSDVVKQHYENNQPDVVIKVRHLIEENKNRVNEYKDFGNMAFRSLYWEEGAEGDKFLAKRGFRRFRVVAPRWDSITTDMIYGYGPGWHAIGDIKQLQTVTKDKLIAEQKVNDPPMIQDASVVGNVNKIPGGVTKTNSAVPNSGVRPAYQIQPNIQHFELQIQNLRNEIDKHMFANIFLMVSAPEVGNRTAFEVAKIEQEKVTMMGPVLHSLNEEMHDEVIDIVYDIVNDAGLLPEPPEGLAGQEVKVQYISLLAQEQMALGISSIERVIGYVSNLNAIAPGMGAQAAKVLDIDSSVREVANLSGAPAKIINSDREVQALREAEIEQQNKALALQAGLQVADAASKLGKTPMNGEQPSVLDGLSQAAGAASRG